MLPSVILVGGLFLAALAALALIAARRAGALDARRQAATEHERLAGEQMALRRVATLVAQGPPPAAVFDAVAAEMEGLLNADGVMLSRYQPDSEVSMVAHRGSGARLVPPGTRARHEPESVSAIVRRTRCPARMDNYTGTHGAIGELVQSLGVRAAVGAPVAVDGRLWGVIIATWTGEQVPPADTEQRMARFAQLLETAIANADARDQLTASRARLLTAGDEVGRRLVRDLHDGAQQRLMHTIVTLKLAQRALRNGDGDVAPLVDEALEQAQRGTAELRELAHGILPTRLTRGGLREAVDAAAEGLAVRVQVDVPDDRFGSEVEANAYFIIVEALTNVVRHARAEHAEVRVCVHDRTLRIEVRDDGIGGADPHGRGLVGVGDRATALGGRLDIASPNGGGTLVTARLPLTRGDQGAAPAPP